MLLNSGTEITTNKAVLALKSAAAGGRSEIVKQLLHRHPEITADDARFALQNAAEYCNSVEIVQAGAAVRTDIDANT